jgi:hypothetical protein
LPIVGAAGGVTGQRCIVELVREEDGLDPSQMYTFSIRVGDMYHMSEWSTPSSTVKLTAPPPQMVPSLSSAEAQIITGELTATGFRAAWPQFLPNIGAGVPLHAEVEYLFTVSVMPLKRRLQGTDRLPDELAHPHGQWLLSSTAPAGASVDSFGRGIAPSVVVKGLTPNVSYDLKLQVRYARLGPRTCTDALSSTVVTSKMDAEAKRMAATAASSAPPLAPSEAKASAAKTALAPWAPILLDAASGLPADTTAAEMRVKLLTKGLSAATAYASDSAPMGSPGKLPPLAAQVEHRAVADEVMAEWKANTEADTERLTGGALATCWNSGMRVTPSAASADDLPARPPDFVPFWRRDPTDVRPAMPSMPSANHPAMQLDLCGRPSRPEAEERHDPHGAGANNDCGAVRKPVAPRPPSRDRTAYPRRIVY